jgi:hypothetical protein
MCVCVRAWGCLNGRTVALCRIALRCTNSPTHFRWNPGALCATLSCRSLNFKTFEEVCEEGCVNFVNFVHHDVEMSGVLFEELNQTGPLRLCQNKGGMFVLKLLQTEQKMVFGLALGVTIWKTIITKLHSKRRPDHVCVDCAENGNVCQRPHNSGGRKCGSSTA